MRSPGWNHEMKLMGSNATCWRGSECQATGTLARRLRVIVVNFGSLGLIEDNENLATFTIKDRSSNCAGFGWRGVADPCESRRHRVVEVRTLRHLLLCDFP